MIESSLEHRAPIELSWSLYFYVPKGTLTVDGKGQLVQTLKLKGNHWIIPVAPGQDGRLWKFEDARGRFALMTVPPYLARSAQEMLLPKEIVESDAPK